MPHDAVHAVLVRARRRLVAAMIVRGAGKLLLAGLGVLLAAGLVQRWTGAAVAWPAGLLAGAVGLAWGVKAFRWPTLMAVAVELDRQYGLKELLSSATAGEGAGGLVSPRWGSERESPASHGLRRGLLHDAPDGAKRQAEDAFAYATVMQARETARGIDLRRLDAGSYARAAWIGVLIAGGLLPTAYAPGARNSAAMAGGSATETAEPSEHRAAARVSGRLGVRTEGAATAPAFASSQKAMTFAAADEGGKRVKGAGGRTESAGKGGTGTGLAQSEERPDVARERAEYAGEAKRNEAGKDASTGPGREAVSAEDGFVHGIAQAAVREAGREVRAEGAAAARPGDLLEEQARQVPAEYRELLKAYFSQE